METASAPLASALLNSARKAHAAGAALRMQDRRVGGAFGDLHAHHESLLEHLSAALEVQRAALFHHHVGWLARACTGRGLSLGDLDDSLACLGEELNERLPAAASRVAVEYVEGARRALATGAMAPEAVLEAKSAHGSLAARYLLAVLEGRRDEAIELVIAPVRAGRMPVEDVLEKVLAPALNEVGRLWQRDEANVSEEHLLSRTTETVVTILSTIAPRAPRRGRRVLVTSVAGDLHDLGLRMVALLLELDGYEVVFLGASTPARDAAAAARDLHVDLVAVSAKLDLHVRGTSELVRTLRALHDVPVIVGGTPFSVVPDLWQVVGANAHARSASDVRALARRLCP